MIINPGGVATQLHMLRVLLQQTRKKKLPGFFWISSGGLSGMKFIFDVKKNYSSPHDCVQKMDRSFMC